MFHGLASYLLISIKKKSREFIRIQSGIQWRGIRQLRWQYFGDFDLYLVYERRGSPIWLYGYIGCRFSVLTLHRHHKEGIGHPLPRLFGKECPWRTRHKLSFDLHLSNWWLIWLSCNSSLMDHPFFYVKSEWTIMILLVLWPNWEKSVSMQKRYYLALLPLSLSLSHSLAPPTSAYFRTPHSHTLSPRLWVMASLLMSPNVNMHGGF